MVSFSQQPSEALDENVKKGYVGLHIGQGVPVLDRDLNLLQDLLHKMVRDVVAYYIGDVVIADGDGFKISALNGQPSNFAIGKGKCLAGGLVISSADRAWKTGSENTYIGQWQDEQQVIQLQPPKAGAGTDIVYIDVWLDDVPIDDSSALAEAYKTDVGSVTSQRVRPKWEIRVAQGAAIPVPQAGHMHHPLARIERTAQSAEITNAMITDLRQIRPGLTGVAAQRLELIERLTVLPVLSEEPFEVTMIPWGGKLKVKGKRFAIGDSVSVTFTQTNKGTIVRKSIQASNIQKPVQASDVEEFEVELTETDFEEKTQWSVKITTYVGNCTIGSVISESLITIAPAQKSARQRGRAGSA